MTRFSLNLDDAGTAVLFLAANSSIGNGGGLYHLFLRSAGRYRSLGLVPLQPEALQALGSKHFGLPDLKSCTHAGGGGYRCTTFVFDGHRYGAVTTVETTGPAVPTEIRPAKILLERSHTISAWKP